MDVPESLRRAYLETEITVMIDGEFVDARRATDVLGSSYFVLTAWNPGSEVFSPRENLRRNESLRAELEAMELTVYPAIGRAPDRKWQEDGYATSGITRRKARGLGRIFGQAAIFEITQDEQRVLGSDGTWVTARPLGEPGWTSPAESTDTFAEAVQRSLGLRVEPTFKRAAKRGWVHEDGVGLHCLTCEATLELFGCELRSKDSASYRAMFFLCPNELTVRLADGVPEQYRTVAEARRAYLRARRDADAHAASERRYWAYCIELDDAVGARPGALPWVYVGQTAKTPEERFAEHLAGVRASRWVRKHGVALRPDLYGDQPVLRTQPEALGYERWLYESLMASGWPVKEGT